MRWRWMASLTLLLLGGAAAPPGPCGPAGNTGPIGQTESTDASRDAGLSAFSVTEESCAGSGVDPSAMQATKPTNGSADALHGLPASEALRPVDQPRAAPVYR